MEKCTIHDKALMSRPSGVVHCLVSIKDVERGFITKSASRRWDGLSLFSISSYTHRCRASPTIHAAATLICFPRLCIRSVRCYCSDTSRIMLRPCSTSTTSAGWQRASEAVARGKWRQRARVRRLATAATLWRVEPPVERSRRAQALDRAGLGSRAHRASPAAGRVR